MRLIPRCVEEPLDRALRDPVTVVLAILCVVLGGITAVSMLGKVLGDLVAR